MALDPVTLAVIDNGLKMVTNEMDLVQAKAAFSAVIAESYDRANGIYGRDAGEVIAQGDKGLPIFIGVMQHSVAWIIEQKLDLEDGDVLIMNDPYHGGTHLMDVKMVRPFFRKGKLWCFLASSGHWPDIGGAVPGGLASWTTSVHAEGLRMPPSKLYRKGKLNQELLNLILANIRVPEERIGDIKAQVGGLSVGERRLRALLDRYGDETVEDAILELRARSERQMRAHIADTPDGVYEFSTFMDSDGVTNEPLEVALELTVKGSDMYFDLSRSSPPCRGPVNTPWSTTATAIYIAIKHVFPDVPINAGAFAPIHIKKPEGTFLLAAYPRPVSGAAAESSQHVVDAVLGALMQALPERSYAGAFGTSGNFSMGGFDPEKERHYIMYFFSGGGYGGWAGGDGLSNGCPTISMAASQPVEILEQAYPILFEKNELRSDSAGAGTYRGGLGTEYRARLIRGSAQASFMMDHGRFPPRGMLGGTDGEVNEISLSQKGRISRPEHLSKGSNYDLDAGDWVEVRTPGGGGYGDPDKRDRGEIERDVVRGYLSEEAAARQYPAPLLRRVS